MAEINANPSSPSAYHLLLQLEQQFDHLLATIEAAVSLYEQQLPATWLFHQTAPSSDWLRKALFDMWHEQDQDGRETRNYIAVVAANDELLMTIDAVNQAKVSFSDQLQHIKQAFPQTLSDAKSRLPKRHPHVDEVLRRNGLARLHLKQSWRQLPIAQAPVSRIRFAWYSSGRSIKRLSVQEAEHKLLQLDTDAPHIRIQLRKLAGIPSGEVLAQVQTQAPLMRANLFFTEPLDDGHTRRALNAAMPIFVPDNNQRLPHINLPTPEPPTARTRARRRDEKLEQDVFLPSLRIYRYR
ncbi:DNA replication terminus site-binding protein [Halomonas sp. IOP_14]|uniref:DNA replication terminus site-binding protein n=1 Tax=Halomonas sp. IOP_14 TaxID=2873295 RepID=UPI001E2D3CFC|nr:DNA replication terminus site-binding protein [Halomonas sp. IOP_14]MCD1587261.1 DNA replication terminus site-binding protein [Halomonas sp. IOP_14]